MDDPYVPVASTLQQTLGGAVDGAVRHNDQLHLLAGEPSGNNAPNHVDVFDDVVATVVDGHDDCQRGPGTRSSRSGGGDRRARRRAGNSHCDDSRRIATGRSRRQGIILSWRLAGPICGSLAVDPCAIHGQDRFHGTPGTSCVAVCAVCGGGWTLPEVSESELASFYPESCHAYQPPVGLLGKLQVRTRQAILGRALGRSPFRSLVQRPPGLLLDVGCGGPRRPRRRAHPTGNASVGRVRTSIARPGLSCLVRIRG